ncbi:winged helix-turn-helix transcriptional regulator [Candidatus Micrarchaeota archaeon]|nr:winged helix-turn-helix transcriptional regulator [Candidatus Micrarchaeota archaeon]
MSKDTKGYCTKFFSALSNRLRIGILQSLLRKEKTVSELTNDLKKERTLISHNLADLLQVNLIYFKKRKQERVYYHNKKIVPPLFFLLENFMCTGCSLKSTCRVMRKQDLDRLAIEAANLKPCSACR